MKTMKGSRFGLTTYSFVYTNVTRDDHWTTCQQEIEKKKNGDVPEQNQELVSWFSQCFRWIQQSNVPDCERWGKTVKYFSRSSVFNIYDVTGHICFTFIIKVWIFNANIWNFCKNCFVFFLFIIKTNSSNSDIIVSENKIIPCGSCSRQWIWLKGVDSC